MQKGRFVTYRQHDGANLGIRNLSGDKKTLGENITNASLRRLARRAGVKRVNAGIYTEIKGAYTVRGSGNEAARREEFEDLQRSALHSSPLLRFLYKIIGDACFITDHAKLKTVTLKSMMLALKRNGHTLYAGQEVDEDVFWTRKLKKKKMTASHAMSKDRLARILDRWRLDYFKHLANVTRESVSKKILRLAVFYRSSAAQRLLNEWKADIFLRLSFRHEVVDGLTLGREDIMDESKKAHLFSRELSATEQSPDLFPPKTVHLISNETNAVVGWLGAYLIPRIFVSKNKFYLQSGSSEPTFEFSEFSNVWNINYAISDKALYPDAEDLPWADALEHLCLSNGALQFQAFCMPISDPSATAKWPQAYQHAKSLITLVLNRMPRLLNWYTFHIVVMQQKQSAEMDASKLRIAIFGEPNKEYVSGLERLGQFDTNEIVTPGVHEVVTDLDKVVLADAPVAI